jgi:hypothetical protein
LETHSLFAGFFFDQLFKLGAIVRSAVIPELVSVFDNVPYIGVAAGKFAGLACVIDNIYASMLTRKRI